jgi:hypothetical protein
MVPQLSQGTDLCQCVACGEFFKSSGTFTRHRVGNWDDRGLNRRCLTVEEMLAKGWGRNDGGFWVRDTLRIRRFPSRETVPCPDKPETAPVHPPTSA